MHNCQPVWPLIPNKTSSHTHSEAANSPMGKLHILLNKHKLGDNDIHLFSSQVLMQHFSKASGISIACRISNAFELPEKLHLLAPVYTAESYQVNSVLISTALFTMKIDAGCAAP